MTAVINSVSSNKQLFYSLLLVACGLMYLSLLTAGLAAHLAVLCPTIDCSVSDVAARRVLHSATRGELLVPQVHLVTRKH